MNTQNKPADQKRVLVSKQVYSAPLPPPQVLADYDKVYSGTAKIIVETFKSQVEHRMSMEKKEIMQSLLGQVFAFIIAFSLVVLAFFSLLKGHPEVASVVCSITLASVIYTFIAGKKKDNQKNNQNQNKNQY